MDVLFSLIILFLILFAIKIYFACQKSREGFRFHRRRKPPSYSSSSTQQQQETDDLTENMSVPKTEDEINKVKAQSKNLHKVYVDNTSRYSVKGEDSPVDITIPEIPTVPDLNVAIPSMDISIPSLGPGIPGINIPLPFDKITDPIQDIVNKFLDIANTTFEFFNTVIEYLNITIHYFTCAFTLMINFFTVPCLFWYMLDLVSKIVYLPFAFFFWLIGISDIIEDKLWGPLYIVDGVFYDYVGFHFAHFPDSIMKGCYSCPAEFEILDTSKFTWIGDYFKNIYTY